MMPSYDPNAKLAGKIRARHVAAIKRERAGLSRALWDYFARAFGQAAGATTNAVTEALRAFQRRRELHYGLANCYSPHAGRQEILRARLGGFYQGHTIPAGSCKREIVRQMEAA